MNDPDPEVRTAMRVKTVEAPFPGAYVVLVRANGGWRPLGDLSWTAEEVRRYHRDRYRVFELPADDEPTPEVATQATSPMPITFEDWWKRNYELSGDFLPYRLCFEQCWKDAQAAMKPPVVMSEELRRVMPHALSTLEYIQRCPGVAETCQCVRHVIRRELADAGIEVK